MGIRKQGAESWIPSYSRQLYLSFEVFSKGDMISFEKSLYVACTHFNLKMGDLISIEVLNLSSELTFKK